MIKNKEKVKRNLRWLTSRTILLGSTFSLVVNKEEIAALPMESKLIIGGGYIGALTIGFIIEPPTDFMEREANPRLPVHVNKKIKK